MHLYGMRGVFLARLGGLTFFEEESNLVAAVEKIFVADMFCSVAGGEFGHRVVFEGEVIEHGVGFREERGDRFGVEGVGDDEIAITFKAG